MRISGGETSEPGAAAGLLNRVARPHIYVLPDHDGRRGDFDYLKSDWRMSLPAVFTSMALAGAVLFATWILKTAWFAFHIPFPGR